MPRNQGGQRGKFNPVTFIAFLFLFLAAGVISLALVLGGAWGALFALLFFLGAPAIFVIAIILLSPLEFLIIIGLILYFKTTGKALR